MAVEINGHELPDHISYSSFTTWQSCGWLYYLTRILKLQDKPAWWLVGGSALHEATADYDRQTFEP
jgi:ATP-dependent helicase/DNAse subunit B